MNEVKGYVDVLYNTSKPQHLGDGIKSGLGNIVKGTLAGAAAAVVAPIVGAQSGGVTGFAKGLLGGLAAGAGLTAAGGATGLYQMVRGVYNTKNSIV